MGLKLAELFVDITVKGDKSNKKIQTMRGSVTALSSKFLGLTAGVASAAYGMKKLADGALYFIGLANIQEKAEAKLGQVLKSTGHAAGFSLKQLKNYASELQGVTTYGDETTLSMLAVLATFKNIKGDEFKRATELIMDMSVALDQDLKSASIMVGKALNDPISGITAMNRAGIQFTKDQKETIRTLVEENRIMEAQKIIMDEMAGQFGGTAKAAAKTFGGEMEKLKNEIGDLGEALGKRLTPAAKELVNTFRSDMMPALKEAVDGGLGEWMREMAEGAGVFAQGLVTVIPLLYKYTGLSLIIRGRNLMGEGIGASMNKLAGWGSSGAANVETDQGKIRDKAAMTPGTNAYNQLRDINQNTRYMIDKLRLTIRE